MSETKAPESVYSHERTNVTGPNSLRSTFETSEPTESENAPGGSEPAPAQTPEKTATAKPPQASEAQPSSAPGGSSFPGSLAPGAAGIVADFAKFLNRTKQVWLIAAGVILAVMVIETVSKRMAERAKLAREARQEHAVTEVTPEVLLARCGQPAEDVTKDLYPMVARRMSYEPRENEKVVFEFSRTAEENSQWLFLSMKDGNGKTNFDTPQAKIAALPCLDTKR